ncbi:ATP-grasp domain-containing protein [Vibrio sp. ZSDE26]|uniref:ATP-grasp domain-containing protein n=1 Tax=Vibrio amylolyticus TaxID=2847292 RepID=A0A9X1XJY4_9VIBR|nr:ATP-grasp domain-containing protein [Vibrio amylolyticus]MCK6263253.1 ATP-grasp domain-containing protein [Vibrio amylolyticus]
MYKINNKVKTVLVSGGGGDIGIAIGRILKECEITKVVGCDVERGHAGECVFDDFRRAPLASESGYFDFLKQIFEEFSVDLFIPSSEAEIKATIDFGLINGQLFGVEVLITNQETALVALDKLKTAEILKTIGVRSPWTELALKMPRELPCIFKPKSGQGSKGLRVVHSEAEAKDLLGNKDYIWQELLLPDEQEFTCGVFRHSSGVTRSIVMRRTLSGGFTDKGEVVENSEIDSYIFEIAKKLNIFGAVNFQLRLTSCGPVLFEINPRLSSTVMFRHKLGFRDLIWAIEDRFNLPLDIYVAPKAGTKFYRGIQEYIK